MSFPHITTPNRLQNIAGDSIKQADIFVQSVDIGAILDNFKVEIAMPTTAIRNSLDFLKPPFMRWMFWSGAAALMYEIMAQKILS